MEHLDTGTLENWYANRALPLPGALRRLAVIAPDDAPGLSALRQGLARRTHSLNCDHFAAGFEGAASASLADTFDQVRQRHASQPYDLVLLLEGRPEALGIAESNSLIPEQVSRMPVPVWTAIGEDDANTALGDVANRVFASPAALIAALPLPAPAEPVAAAAPPASAPAAAPALPQPAARAPDLADAALPVAPPAPARASPHPLVLCAAGAVIVASLTAIAAMLGWLPVKQLEAAAVAKQPAALVTTTPRSVMPAAELRAAEAPVVVPAASDPEALPEPAPAPQSESAADSAALAAAGVAGAAGMMAAAPRGKTAENAPAKRARRTVHRTQQTPPAYAQTPRQVGSTEVPVVEFVGTKSREQVIAEMVEARRAASRQAANSNYFPGIGSPARR